MYIYPNYEEVVNTHNEIIAKTGGISGVIDDNLLHSSVNMIRDDIFYPSFESKLTHIIFSLAKNHCFRDGNKRTALAVSALFLEYNNTAQSYINTYITMMEHAILLTAASVINKDELFVIVSDLVNFGELQTEAKYLYAREV